MTSDSIWLSQCSNFCDRIIITKSIFWCWGNQAYSIWINLPLHSTDISLKVLGYGNLSLLNSKEMTCLIMATMSRLRHYQVWSSHTSFCLCFFTVRQYCKEEAFCPSTCDNAAGILVAVVQIESPTNDFSLHLQYILKLVHVQRVGDNGYPQDIWNEIPVSLIFVIDASSEITCIVGV